MPTGSPAKQPAVMVLLSCKHEASYRAPLPMTGESVYCRRCHDYRTVELVPEYRIRCDSCRLSRKFGRDLGAARMSASKHTLTRTTHVVSIMDGETLTERVGRSLGEGELPFDSIVNERRMQAKTNQQMLRDFVNRSIDKRSMEP